MAPACSHKPIRKQPTLDNLLVVLVIVLLSMVVQSTFSFGGALVALPLLALVVDVKAATVLMTMLSCSIAVAIVAELVGVRRGAIPGEPGPTSDLARDAIFGQDTPR